MTQDQAFAHASGVLKHAVGGIIHMHGLANVDHEDVTTLMGERKPAMNAICRYAAEDAR